MAIRRTTAALAGLLVAAASPARALEVGSLGLALVSAAWTSGRSMASPRQDQTATLLPNGLVLVAGGNSGTAALASAELYDPATGSWSPTGSMAGTRQAHTATLLTSGKVLVVGGSDGIGNLVSAELYEPSTGTWSATGSLSRRARAHHAAVRLPTGKVLVAGGSASGSTDDDAELYDPATATWSAAGTMVQKRSDHGLVSLPGGKVLAVGGLNLQTGVSTAGAELYDPATGTWTATGSLLEARSSASAVLLPTGKVLVAGGLRYFATSAGSGMAFVSSAELYDPVAGTWAATATLAQATVQRAAGALLPSGRFLIENGSYSQVYDPVAETWSAVVVTPVARYQQTATVLPSGKVLVAGGYGYIAPSWVVLASSEEYDPAVPAWSLGGAFAGLGALTLTPLPNGRTAPVLAVGGWSGTPSGSAFLCDGAAPAGCRRPRWPRPAPATPRRCSPPGRCWWRAARPTTWAPWPASSAMTSPATPGRPWRPCRRRGRSTRPRSCHQARSWWREATTPAGPWPAPSCSIRRPAAGR